MGLNKVIEIGRLTRDPEIKTFSENTKCATFTLAVDRRFKSKNENAPTADFLPVTAWRGTAEFVEKYFAKGKQVYVSGWIETYSYEKDGQKVFSFRINADEVGFADTMKSENGNQQNTGGNGYSGGNNFSVGNTQDNFGQFEPIGEFDDDTLPF